MWWDFVKAVAGAFGKIVVGSLVVVGLLLGLRPVKLEPQQVVYLVGDEIKYAKELPRISIGDEMYRWDCAQLPRVDFRNYDRVYCTDANGRIVELRVVTITDRRGESDGGTR